MEKKIFLSLGSNLGDRESNLAQATMALSINLNIKNIKSSSYYESEPLYNTDQPKFLNSVVCCESNLNPFEFFDVTRRIEKMLGRPKKRLKNHPRIIDIDLLFFRDSVLETEKLTLPHPMVSLRKFVLIPLSEIAPNYSIPNTNMIIKDLLNNCPDNSKVVKHIMGTQA
ncbi:MAG: 2-amino-4-hydroxy-6-hydroxymethyldihydropteridine diphosphokinase [Candidatus Marinimicrobia bacterium]|nr:2-amino-4-hydroxy-6-hydroxymethyldihydropteridine diphosphokinase [Candidatus Neomarinimicrobiota bacterium]|tara:strand:+ start:612 stop:1118 length:507 start_codon:yes stop_codon:yes gene_type:complete